MTYLEKIESEHLLEKLTTIGIFNSELTDKELLSLKNVPRFFCPFLPPRKHAIFQ